VAIEFWNYIRAKSTGIEQARLLGARDYFLRRLAFYHLGKEQVKTKFIFSRQHK
jgi:hypothetical protein